MKFLCDVHISYKIQKFLNNEGYKTVHVNEILNKWNSTDQEISQYADQHDLIVITKDSDFRDSYFVKHSPKKLIKVNLGNVSNQEFINMLAMNLTYFASISKKACFMIELDKTNTIVHL